MTSPEPHRRPLDRVLRPLERFLHVQTSGSMVLLAAAVVAMAWANSPVSRSYEGLWHSPVTLGIGEWTSVASLHFWINDGLMTIFFFVVGLEVRREMHEGELADARRAALPVAAAIGGMLVPALLYLAIAGGNPGLRSGWGVPMATDIAFAVGVLAILGRRVPPALRVLLLALAIIDDIGAILVIAFFYSSGIDLVGLGIVAGGVMGLLGFQWLGVRRPLLYVIPGAVIWAGFLSAGVHPTLAGVLVGMLTPVRVLVEGELPPARALESALHPWVAFVIMPLFALANAGVSLGGVDLDGPASLVTWGVLLGLVVGKPAGVVLASAACVKLGLCRLPRGVTWAGISVVGLVAGIGFTMAVFIAGLAFQSPAHLAAAKLGIIVASTLAGIVGLIVGRVALPREAEPGAATTLAEAELSAEQ